MSCWDDNLQFFLFKIKIEFFSNKKFCNYLNNIEVTLKKVLKSYYIIQVGF